MNFHGLADEMDLGNAKSAHAQCHASGAATSDATLESSLEHSMSEAVSIGRKRTRGVLGLPT